MPKQITTLADLQPDSQNANTGTERGRYMVEASLREVGAGRSIVVDREGRIIAGNKTFETWGDISDPDDVVVVQTTGDKLVVVQRSDLDLANGDEKARKLAYYDNRAGEVGLEWDAEQVLADLNAGLDLDSMFRQDELDELLARMEIPDPMPQDVPDSIFDHLINIKCNIDGLNEMLPTLKEWGMLPNVTIDIS